MKRAVVKLSVFLIMLLGLPLFGLILVQKDIAPYLQFPPQTHHVQHAPFSWPVFVGYALFLLAVIMPYIVQGLRASDREEKTPAQALPFPWWGWLGILLGMAAWILAWNRFSWFSRFQPHTFTPLWIAYIITINALTYRRTGNCMLLDRPRQFLLLFPASAAFWWFFEYLNRFVQNWYYVGSSFDAWEYFWYATLPFSTVLPAFIVTRQWILSFSWPERRFRNFFPIKFPWPKAVAWCTLFVTAAGLAGIGVWPNILFPLLWISPLLIIVSLQCIFRDRHIFSSIPNGDWRLILCSALAALICGFFWELWNYYSLAKWKYTVPFVHRFQLFEMPILGYAGYLPFGLQCALIADMVMSRAERRDIGDG